jgi:NAD(P)H-dependent flavin oxidoreductase YrpB (nitropropane dioxygenase family)
MFQTQITGMLRIKYPIIMGTLFLLAEECPIHLRLKEALLKATELETMVGMQSIRSAHRLWANEAAKKVAELESQGAALEEIIRLGRTIQCFLDFPVKSGNDFVC